MSDKAAFVSRAIDTSLATVSLGHETQAVHYIVAINVTSFIVVITDYSKDATIMHKTAQRICVNLQYGE